MERPNRVSESWEHHRNMEEQAAAARESIRAMQNGQVDEAIEGSPYLEKYKDALYQLRDSNGWLKDEDVPLVVGEEQVLISREMFDGSLGWNTTHYKVIEGVSRPVLEDLSRLNQLPEYADGFRIEDVAPVSEYEIQTRIMRRISDKLSKEVQNFESWPIEKKRALLEKYELT